LWVAVAASLTLLLGTQLTQLLHSCASLFGVYGVRMCMCNHVVWHAYGMDCCWQSCFSREPCMPAGELDGWALCQAHYSQARNKDVPNIKAPDHLRFAVQGTELDEATSLGGACSGAADKASAVRPRGEVPLVAASGEDAAPGGLPAAAAVLLLLPGPGSGADCVAAGDDACDVTGMRALPPESAVGAAAPFCCAAGNAQDGFAFAAMAVETPLFSSTRTR
jgi:hypothetical protein